MQELFSWTNAHMPGVLFFEQLSGLECLHPIVLPIVSPSSRGLLGFSPFLIITNLMF